MQAYAKQELAAGLLFFGPCGWLLTDLVLSAPDAPPALWPLLPMFAAVAWHVTIEHLRARKETGG